MVGKLMKLLKKMKVDCCYGGMVEGGVKYVVDEEKRLKVLLEDGRVEMDKNGVEGMLGELGMGRGKWIDRSRDLGGEKIGFML